MITNIPAPDHLDKLLHLPLAVFFFENTNERKMEAISSQIQMSSFQKTLVSHLRANTYSALSFDRKQRGAWFAFNFMFKWKAIGMYYCFCQLFKTVNYCRLSNYCQIVCPVHVSGSSNRKPYNKHLISVVFFGPYCKSRILVFFFPSITRAGHKLMAKTGSVIYSTGWNFG